MVITRNVVRVCCPNRARLRCRRRRAAFRVSSRSRLRGSTRVELLSRARKSVQPDATRCNPMQPRAINFVDAQNEPISQGAVGAVRGMGVRRKRATRTHMPRNAPTCPGASRNVAKCQVRSRKRKTNPIRTWCSATAGGGNDCDRLLMRFFVRRPKRTRSYSPNTNNPAPAATAMCCLPSIRNVTGPPWTWPPVWNFQRGLPVVSSRT